MDFHKGSRGTLSIGWSTHAEASAFIDAWQSHGEEGLRHVEVRWCPTLFMALLWMQMRSCNSWQVAGRIFGRGWEFP